MLRYFLTWNRFDLNRTPQNLILFRPFLPALDRSTAAMPHAYVRRVSEEMPSPSPHLFQSAKVVPVVGDSAPARAAAAHHFCLLLRLGSFRPPPRPSSARARPSVVVCTDIMYTSTAAGRRMEGIAYTSLPWDAHRRALCLLVWTAATF